MGQSLLLARRLVEAGVSIVQVNMGPVQYWDTHVDNFGRLKDQLLPPFDEGLSALVEDLHASGRLDETLVVVAGEFGRTPKISTMPGQTRPGRDHWSSVFTALFAGPGIAGGRGWANRTKSAPFRSRERTRSTIWRRRSTPCSA